MVPKFSLVTRIHVLTAIKVHDQLGAVEFLTELGFPLSSDEVLVERGKRYHPGALLAYAHGRATGQTLTADEVPFGATKVLSDLGFRIATPHELTRPTASARVPGTRAPRATTPKPAKPVPVEPEVKLCPRCHTAVPVSGLCDYCD